MGTTEAFHCHHHQWWQQQQIIQRHSIMDNKEGGFYIRHVRDPCRTIGHRCRRLVKEQRAKFYILRRCVVMLLCWHDCTDS
ncbi:hypothetical protein QJS10_CPA09g01798 [Acorus calamus]|uniref:Uncharacterized protein n=1 Tax=Acorus calamus TaxID=4465 RepID=A0AAV9E7L4_ACOCL|nr:hypothetical protein QJS10_CPA09g01798 [Acorus calamus]